MKIRRRLGVSETPVTVDGPMMRSSRMCGSSVIPCPIDTSASVFSSGITRSSGIASKLADERRRDALRPGLDVNRRRLRLEVVLRIRLAHARVQIEHAPTRSPSIETSICSLRSNMLIVARPTSPPSGS